MDMDVTDDPAHGQQEFTFFHGYYGQYMYHPLFVFDGASGFPLAAGASSRQQARGTSFGGDP